MSSWAQAQSSPAFEDFLIDNLAERLFRVCGSLIQIHGDTVSIAHLSVQEFLTEGVGNPTSEGMESNARIGIEKSHHLFACICVDYLAIGGYGFPLTSENEPENWSGHKLLDYASSNMMYHFNRSGIFIEDLSKRLIDLSQSASFLSWIEHLAIHIVDNGTTGWEISELLSFTSQFENEEFGDRLLQQVGKLAISKSRNRNGPHGEGPESMWLSIAGGLQGWLTEVVEEPAIDEAVAEAMPTATDTRVDKGSTEDPSMHISQASEWMEILTTQSLPIPKQLKMVLRISQSLQGMKALAHPMDLFYRALLKYAEKLPIYAVLVAVGYCHTMKKYEIALELCQIALAKLKIRGVPMEYFILRCKAVNEEALQLWPEAERSYRATVEGTSRIYGSEHWLTLATMNMWGNTLEEVEEFGKAEEIYRKAMNVWEKKGGQEPRTNPLYDFRLSDLFRIQGIIKDTDAFFCGETKTSGLISKLKNSFVGWAVLDLGRSISAQGRYAEAEVIFKEHLAKRMDIKQL